METLAQISLFLGQVNLLIPFVISIAGLIARNESAIIFGVACLVFALIAGDRIDAQDYHYYYLFAGIVDYLIVRMISTCDDTDLVIQRAAQRFIYINLLGWAFFMVYISTDEYYKWIFNLYIVLSFMNYSHVLIRTIGGSNGTDRSNTLDYRIGNIYPANHQRPFVLRSGKTEKEV